MAAIAGEHMKKGCFELGGSDPFVVMEDADLELSVSKAITGRLGCNGQACINAKRFIIHSSIYDSFKSLLFSRLDS